MKCKIVIVLKRNTKNKIWLHREIYVRFWLFHICLGPPHLFRWCYLLTVKMGTLKSFFRFIHSKEYEDLSIKAKSRFSISLRSLAQPMSLEEIARTWDNCARAVISEYAQQSGGGTFSSKYGTWENCLSAAWMSETLSSTNKMLCQM